MFREATILFGLFTATTPVFSHTRLECPPPRTKKTSVKTGPCDGPDDASLPAFPLIPNALNTITWLEAVSHPGAPSRLALSFDGMDEGFEECLLLDMIPHDEWSKPGTDETSFHRSSITVWIPDIYCERCSLQLLQVMSDHSHGVPPDSYCAYKAAQQAGLADSTLPVCPAVYHSCAPVSINGTIPRNHIVACNTPALEKLLEWPFQSNSQQHSTYYSQGNPGMFNQTNARLLAGGQPLQDCPSTSFCDPEQYFVQTVAVPANARYTAWAGKCAAVVGTQVEPFVLGKLPDQVVFSVQEDSSNLAPLCEDDGIYNCSNLLVVDANFNATEFASLKGERAVEAGRYDSQEPISSTGIPSWRPLVGITMVILIVLVSF